LPNLSQGLFKVAPISVDATTTLQDLRMAMIETKPVHNTFSSGWGSTEDDPTWLRRGNFAPAAGDPFIIEGFRDYPDVLAARLYWFKLDSAASLYLGDAPTGAQRYSLQGIDVLISAKPTGGFTVLLTTRDARDQNRYVLSPLRSLFTAVDQDSSVHADSSPLEFASPDFFLWLIYRALNNSQLTDDIELETLRDARTQDRRFRGASFTNGIDPDRREVLSLLMSPSSKFGPVKLLLRDEEIGLTVDFELFLDGGFSITQGESFYDDDDMLPHQRLYSVLDLAHHIVPALRTAYENETHWPTLKPAFREDCYNAMSAPVVGGFADL
jgi:hypothetical protein